MTTRVVPPSSVTTVRNGRLVTDTIHLVQPDFSLATAIPSAALRAPGSLVAKHSAHYFCILDVPVAVTNRSPLTIVENLNTSFIGLITFPDTDCNICSRTRIQMLKLLVLVDDVHPHSVFTSATSLRSNAYSGTLRINDHINWKLIWVC